MHSSELGSFRLREVKPVGQAAHPVFPKPAAHKHSSELGSLRLADVIPDGQAAQSVLPKPSAHKVHPEAAVVPSVVYPVSHASHPALVLEAAVTFAE